LYRIVNKFDRRKTAEFVSKDEQLLPPFVELMWRTEQAVDGFIDVIDKTLRCAINAFGLPKA